MNDVRERVAALVAERLWLCSFINHGCESCPVSVQCQRAYDRDAVSGIPIKVQSFLRKHERLLQSVGQEQSLESS